MSAFEFAIWKPSITDVSERWSCSSRVANVSIIEMAAAFNLRMRQVGFDSEGELAALWHVNRNVHS